LYSLWKKLERPGIEWDFDKVRDVVALRILVDEVKECYAALGVVHSMYKPVPKEGLSDFIAQPKPNGYKSIHTKVFGRKRMTVEIQIRTYKMHEQAERGIAAHWAYGEAKTKNIDDERLEKEGVTASEEKLSWVKQLVDWQDEIRDSDEFLEAVKFDALEHRNFVFTPDGDVYDLPNGATPVDYAYAVHTDLGNYIKCAKVNGNITPLSTKLQSGDVVEIVKTKNAKRPNKDWLNFVVTRCAKSEIRKAYK
jgi:guanosine-3',5'-bis(diphosphate) 3'-pyrophosphohydrolase